MSLDHKKGIAAVIGMFAVLSSLFFGVWLLTASLVDPTWLILVGIIVGAGLLFRKQIVRFARYAADRP